MSTREQKCSKADLMDQKSGFLWLAWLLSQHCPERSFSIMGPSPEPSCPCLKLDSRRMTLSAFASLDKPR